MNFHQWYQERGWAYLRQRATFLLDRYGWSPTKAEHRIEACVQGLDAYGCSPTFPTPGAVVDRHPRFLRRLQDRGAEIAVHSYDHVDLRAYQPDQACQQLVRAAQAFTRQGLTAHGFRCPYLGWSEALLQALPVGSFAYSSNQAIWWAGGNAPAPDPTNPIFQTLVSFYRPQPSTDTVCVPHAQDGLIEIPVCVPDDLQYYDGLHLGPDAIAQAWLTILHQTYERMELFDLVFHPELADRLGNAFAAVLAEARRLRPAVWIAPLHEISQWWQEKAEFGFRATPLTRGWHLSFQASPRATLLVKGIPPGDGLEPWDPRYLRLTKREIDLPSERPPWVGLPLETPMQWVAFLGNQGYLLDQGPTAPSCAVYMAPSFWDQAPTQVQVVAAIENAAGPLVRYGRWPEGAKSALSISGDLDAVSLIDYAARLWMRQ